MSTKPSKPPEAVASKKEEEEDLAALIYRESQLRKREAAAAAAAAVKKRKMITSASNHHRTTSCRHAPRSLLQRFTGKLCEDIHNANYMGLGSRLRNLFSPRGKGKQRSGDRAAANNANAIRTIDQQNQSTTPSVAGTKIVAAEQSSSSSKKKGHCTSPGCTRTLYARGKCYRHDVETKKREEGIEDKKPAAAAKKKVTSPKKRHCCHPGCTRARFARGKCYRHDQATKSGKTSTPNGEEKLSETIAGKKRSSSTDRNNAVISAASKPGLAGEAKATEATKSVADTKPAAAKKPEGVKAVSRQKKGHCRYPGCTRAIFARGKCHRHDQETNRSGRASPVIINAPSNSSTVSSAGMKRKIDAESTPTTSSKAKIAKRFCSYPGCTRALFARGMCYRHDTTATLHSPAIDKSCSSIFLGGVAAADALSTASPTGVGELSGRCSVIS
jgi:hypothetical protein